MYHQLFGIMSVPCSCYLMTKAANQSALQGPKFKGSRVCVLFATRIGRRRRGVSVQWVDKSRVTKTKIKTKTKTNKNTYYYYYLLLLHAHTQPSRLAPTLERCEVFPTDKVQIQILLNNAVCYINY